MSRRTLHIAVDGRELSGQPTGVGRYLRHLLDEWARDSRGHRITVLGADGTGRGTLWEQTRLPRLVRAAGADVLFAPGYTAPLRLRIPTVLVVHDVSFFAQPEGFAWREGARRRMVTKASARLAAAIVTVSDFSAGEIARWLGVPRERVHVIPHGAPAFAACGDAGSSPAAEPVVLFVGSLFTRRRIPDLIAGFARARQTVPGARLVLVGANRTRPPIDPLALAAAAGIAGAVEWRTYVADDELTAVSVVDSRNAFFVFCLSTVSLYESQR